MVFAAELHAGQVKKGGHNIPYISHLLGVTSLVIEAGGDEDMAIAALLHDAVEDQGGRPTLERIRSEYGERVAHIVEGLYRFGNRTQTSMAGTQKGLRWSRPRAAQTRK